MNELSFYQVLLLKLWGGATATALPTDSLNTLKSLPLTLSADISPGRGVSIEKS